MPAALMPTGGLFATLLALIGDASYSWIRMLIALTVSILVSLAVGIWAARSERAGKVILPLVDIFQTLPILAFFPFAIYLVVTYLPSALGVNIAVIFLIITSMIWNIIFGVYESINATPKEIMEVGSIYRLSRAQRIRRIYVPAAMPKVVEQAGLSFAIGLFYLVTSEIFAVGSTSYSVNGIGVALAELAISGNFLAYAIGLGVFIVFVLATRYVLFAQLEKKFSLTRQFAPYTRGRRHLGLTTRVRLSREISRLMSGERRAVRPFAREIAKETGAAVSFSERVFSRVQTHPRLKSYHYIAILIIVAASVLYLAGYINATTIGYEGQVLIALAASFTRIWFAFVLVLIAAIPISVYIVFFSKRINGYLTLFQVLASIPATIVLPIIVLVLVGVQFHAELVAIIVFFLSGIWYIVFSVIAEARTMGTEVLEVKKLFSVKGFSAWKNVYLRVIAPGLITGGVTAIAAEWNASIVAEYFTSTGIGSGTILSSVGVGIGKLLDTSLSSGNLTLMLIALINLTIMIIIINTFLWKRLYRRMSEIYS